MGVRDGSPGATCSQGGACSQGGTCSQASACGRRPSGWRPWPWRSPWRHRLGRALGAGGGRGRPARSRLGVVRELLALGEVGLVVVQRLAAQRGLAAAQGFAHELVGEHQARLADIGQRQAHAALFVGLGIVAVEQREASPRSRPPRPGSACGRRPGRPSRPWPDARPSGRNRDGAHQRPVDAGRRDLQVVGAPDRVVDVEGRRHARLTASQSSTVKEPSGRSAMIWTVQPFWPEMRTRTSRKPRSCSTGSTIAPTRAATPCSVIILGSSISAKEVLATGPGEHASRRPRSCCVSMETQHDLHFSVIACFLRKAGFHLFAACSKPKRAGPAGPTLTFRSS